MSIILSTSDHDYIPNSRLILEYVNEGKAQLEQRQRDRTLSDNEMGVLEKLLKIDRQVAMIMTMDALTAGVDTTSASVYMLLLCLAQNQPKQDLLRQELTRILPDFDSKLTPENMKNMPYLRACLKESYRTRPIFPGTVRNTGRDMVIKGYKVPQNVSF